MIIRSLPLAICVSLTLAACSQEDSDSGTTKQDATTAAAPAPPAPTTESITGAEREFARLQAVRQDCFKRPPAPVSQGATPPLVDGLYQHVPRDKTFSSVWWLSNRRTVLLNEPRDNAAEAVTLAPQSWVKVVEDLVFTVPIRGIVLRPKPGGDLNVCDIVYLVDSEDGEGESTKWVWGRGRIFSLDQNDGPADADASSAPYIEWEWPETEPAPLAPAAAARAGHWVRVTGPGGATGWVRGGMDDFDCIWENDRYLDGKPTKCAGYPGAEATP